MTPMMITVFAILGALAGLAVRSTVFSLSVPAERPPRTDCPRCHAAILGHGHRTEEVLVWGRCRRCHSRIAPPPLLVEVPLGVVFALLAYRQSDVWAVLAFCWLSAHGAAAALVDLAVRRVPNVLTLSSYIGVVAFLAVQTASGHDWAGLLKAVIGGIGLAVFYLVLAVASRGGLGLGDVKLAAGLGTALSWIGITALVAGTVLGLLLAGATGLAAILMGRLRWHQQFPFGPCLVLGALLILLVLS